MAFISYDQYVPNNNFDPIDLDIKGLAGIAAKEQSDYDSNFLKLSALKQGYLNIDLLNQEDKDQLNQYNEQIGNWFTNNRNANFADTRTIESVSKLFNPISKNPDLLAGARTTSLYKQNQQLIEQSKKDKTYSSTSHANLMHDMEQYRNAKGQDKLNWSPRPYVPDCDYGKNFAGIAAKIKPSSEFIDPTQDPSWTVNGGAMTGTKNEVNTQRYFSAFAGAADDCFQNQMRERSYYNLNNNPAFKNDIYKGKVSLNNIGITDATNNITRINQQLKEFDTRGIPKTAPEYQQLSQTLTSETERLNLLNTELKDLQTPEGLSKFLNRNQAELLNDATEILGFQTLNNMAQGFAYSNITGGRFTNNRQQELAMQANTALQIQAMKGAQAQAKAAGSGKTQVGTNADGTPIYADGITDDKGINQTTPDGYTAYVENNKSVNAAYTGAKTNLANSMGIGNLTGPDLDEAIQNEVVKYKTGVPMEKSRRDLVESVIVNQQLAKDSNIIMGQLSDEALKRVNAKTPTNNGTGALDVFTNAAFGPNQPKQDKYKSVADLLKGSSVDLDLYTGISGTLLSNSFEAPNNPNGMLYYLQKNGIDVNNIPVEKSQYAKKSTLGRKPTFEDTHTTIGQILSRTGELNLTAQQAKDLQAYLNKDQETRNKASLGLVDYVNEKHGGDNTIMSKYIKGSGIVDYYKEYNNLAKSVTYASKIYNTNLGALKPAELDLVTRNVSTSFNRAYDVLDEEGNKVDIQAEEMIPQSSTRDYTNVRMKLVKTPGENAKSKTYTLVPKGVTSNSAFYPTRTVSTDGNTIQLNIPNDNILNQYANPAVVNTQGTIRNKAETIWSNAYKLDKADKIDHTEVLRTNKGETVVVTIDPQYKIPNDRSSGFTYDAYINGVMAEVYIQQAVAKMKNPPPNLESTIRATLDNMSDTDPDEMLRVLKEFIINK